MPDAAARDPRRLNGARDARAPPDAQRHPLHRDHGMALLSAAAAGLAIAACCAFWIGTAWSNGATAALMAAIFSCCRTIPCRASCSS